MAKNPKKTKKKPHASLHFWKSGDEKLVSNLERPYHEDSEEVAIPDTLSIRDTQEIIQPTQDTDSFTPYNNDNGN